MSQTTTLDEARQFLRLNWDDGTDCPCCTQRVQRYRRKLNSGMAWALVVLYREAGTDWAHLPTVLGKKQADEAKLRYWGLLEEAEERRDDGGRAGWWRLTELGARFARNQTTVPKYALTFDGKCYGLDGPLVSITDCLGEKFHYDDLIGGLG